MSHQESEPEEEFTRSERAELKRLALASKLLRHVTIGFAALIGLLSAIATLAHSLWDMWHTTRQ